MINYEISVVDKVLKYVQVSYSRDGYETYWIQRALPDDFSDQTVHDIAVEAVEEAQQYWDEREEDTPHVMEETTGQKKTLVLTPEPEFDGLYEYLTFEWDESGDDRVKVWTVNQFSDGRKASNIRRKRNALLLETDSEGLSDRVMSEELAGYRQALRDITNQETFPSSVIWPIKPIG